MTGSADVVHGSAPDEGRRPEEAKPQAGVNEIQARQHEGRRPEEAEPQAGVNEIQARQVRAEGPKTTQTTGSLVVVDESAGAPMRAKGPKRPKRKLISVRFKQDE